MAKITITIEDAPDGSVRLVSNPTMETFFKMDLSGSTLTPSQTYALAMLNRAREVSRQRSDQVAIHIPRVRGRSI